MDPPATSIGFLLLPGFALAPVAGMLDAIAEANRLRGSPAFEVILLSADGEPVASSAGLSLPVGAGVDGEREFTTVIVACDAPLPEHGAEREIAWIRRQASRGADIGGVGTGAWILARAGLLDGYRATLSWPYAALLSETFTSVVVSSNLFEIDRCRLTAAGGAAGVDMMVHWLVGRDAGAKGVELADRLGLEKLRSPTDQQRIPLATRLGRGQPKLTEAVALMEANHEEPLPTEEIARLVGVSRRQLERLFKQYLDSLPSRYYLNLRLARSRQLLRETSQSILQIGLSCGFSSGPHFSSAYRAHFGITPREERSRGGLTGTAPKAGSG